MSDVDEHLPPKSEKFDEDRKMRSATLDIFLASDHQVSGESVACETTAPFAVENHTDKEKVPWTRANALTATLIFILDSGQ